MANITKGIRTTTIPFEGSATLCPVTLENNRARYVALYSQTGNCVISFGTNTDAHATNAVTIAEGKWLEPGFALGQINYTGASTNLLVVQDVSSRVMLTSDGRPLTYDGEYLYHPSSDFKFSAPVFS